MKRLTDGEREILAELNADAEDFGPEYFGPYEREEYERWLDSLDGPAGYFAPPAIDETEYADGELPF